MTSTNNTQSTGMLFGKRLANTILGLSIILGLTASSFTASASPETGDKEGEKEAITIPFITTWKTDNAGTSASNEITIPTTGGGYNYSVTWTEVGNPTNSGSAGSFTGSATVAFPTSGTYEVSITGTFPRIYFNNVGDKEKLLRVDQWGDNIWTNMTRAFYGCSNLTIPATDDPELSSVTNMSQMFRGASSINVNVTNWSVGGVTNMSNMFRDATSYNPVQMNWNVSGVTNMASMFYGATAFNTDIGGWNTMNVTNMSNMFREATSFNQNIGYWSVASVTRMNYMFFNASNFNQDIGSWSTYNVTQMQAMFRGASLFNQNIGGWAVTQVTNMSQMFRDATSFNQPLGGWDVSNVTNMASMFFNCSVFNTDLSNWDTGKVTNMNSMFRNNLLFNSDISNWNTSNVTTMALMFYLARAFDQDISGWDVSKVTNMSQMFRDANAFNQSVGTWDVSAVVNMSNMFRNTHVFNGDIGSWNVANVTNMAAMFDNADAFNQNIGNWSVGNVTTMVNMFRNGDSFNQPIGNWDVSSVTNMQNMFRTVSSFDQNLGNWDVSNVTNFLSTLNGAGLSSDNYDATLAGWSSLPSPPTGVTLHANGIPYCSTEARDALINTHSWTILGDVPGTNCKLPEPAAVSIDEDINFTASYNGNISAIRWKTDGGEEELFTYSYDNLNRLKTAEYAVLGATNYDVNKGHFSVPSLSYDLNGNILSLSRQGISKPGNVDLIDDLSYSYGAGNQLVAVGDTRGEAGFYNQNYEAGDDYSYDSNGNMVKDLNKKIIDIDYNHLNLPVKVTLQGTGNHIEYLYDAAGIKLQQKVWRDDTLRKTTDYIGEFIYEDNHDGSGSQLQLIQHEEGRIIPKTSAGQPEALEGWDYQYHLKDHLGNTRLTFSTAPESYTMTETFETGEENGFEDLHRFTSANANSTAGGDEVSLLQAGETGALVFLGLNKGDTIDLQVQANYEAAPSGNTFLGTAFNALFTSFDNVFGSGVEGGGVSSTNTDFQNALAGTDMGGKSVSSTAPRAYLNYIIFDTAMNYVSAGFQQISTSALGIGVHEAVTIDDIIADREGYVLAYLSNENTEAVNIHFDDFTVVHGKTNVVQTDDYYPGGLTYNSYTRTASTAQNYLYQGKELQPELTTYDFHARMYDPAIWRTFQPDPMSDLFSDHSPYSWVKNNPLLRIDPTGMTDFTFDKKSGAVAQVGETNDDPDRIVKTYKSGKRKGQVKTKKNGDARVAMGGIEKGILANGQNWKTDDQIIEVGGKGQPSVDGVQSFTLGLSEYIRKEISGYSYSSTGSGTTDVLLGKYENNSKTESSSSLADLIKKYRDDFSFNNVTEAFHTHPDGKLGATQSAPHLSKDVENLQRDKPVVPNAIYFILYRVQGQSKPEKYHYTDKYRAPKNKK